MFRNLMGKFREMKAGMDQAIARLENITVEGESYEGMVKVIINWNRVVKDIHINDKLLKDKDAIEDMVVLAMNRALEKAEKVYEAEMQGTAKEFLPPGMGL